MGLFRRGRTTEGAAAGNNGSSANNGKYVKGLTAADLPMRSGMTPVSDWPDPTGAIPNGGIGGVTTSFGARGAKAATGPTSALFAGVCRYYHDCFSADARGGVITNVLDKNQAEYLTFSEGTEALLTGQAYRQELSLSVGVTAQNAADVNRRDKFLIYG